MEEQIVMHNRGLKANKWKELSTNDDVQLNEAMITRKYSIQHASGWVRDILIDQVIPNRQRVNMIIQQLWSFGNVQLKKLNQPQRKKSVNNVDVSDV